MSQGSSGHAHPAHVIKEVHAVLLLAAVLTPHASGQVVINEIFFDPPDVTQPLEFVELYNAGTGGEDLSGWFFSDGIDYVFPDSTVLGAGEYLVVAQDPAAIADLFGTGAEGPFAGDTRLANEGESVVLSDAASNIVDRVDYGLGSPWPTASGGEGSSLELIHPSLDNDLGGSWRASGLGLPSGASTLVPARSTAWIYRKGTSEPPADWADPGYTPDGAWTPGIAPLGYGDRDDNTTLTDMQGSYSTLYLRHGFVLDGTIPDLLVLEVYHDDGAVAWLNGVQIGRFSVPDGFLPFTGLAYNHEAAWSSMAITNAGSILTAGTNVLAIQVLNTTLNSSDLSIDASLALRTTMSATPGAQNSAWATNAPPQVRHVDHEPRQPAADQPVIITAKVTDPQGVGTVGLSYQVVAPGAYLPAWTPLSISELKSVTTSTTPQIPNPAFEDATNWVSVIMRDDGVGADAQAGDDVYSVVVPGQENRALLRYRVHAEDLHAFQVSLPYPDDPSLNFACFVYDGVPAYTAATRSVAGPAPHSHGTDVLNALPTYHLLTRPEDLSDCLAYDGNDQLTNGHASRWVENWEGAVVYEGKVYDHVRYRLRGANGRYLMAGKRSMRIRFNRGRGFEARDRFGTKYPAPWTHLDTGKMFDNRASSAYSGNFGLSESINATLWNMMRVPTPNSHWFHFRVVDGPEEAPAGTNGQYYGDFWGMFLATEYYDRRFLESRGLPDGNLYKLTDTYNDPAREQRVQGYDAVADGSDYWWINSTLTSSRSESELNDQVNIEAWCSYRAVLEGIRIYDFPPGYNKNEAWYFNLTETNAFNQPFGRLWILPYDHDLTWGPNWNNGGERVYVAAYNGPSKPTIRQHLRNRIREFRDLVWTAEVIPALLDDLAARVEAFVPADRDRWKNAPVDAGSMDWGTLEAKVADMKLFALTWDGSYNRWPGGDVSPGGDTAGSRATYLDALANAEGDATAIPYTPVISAASPSGFPANALAFTASAFSDPQGPATFAAMAWRVGEVTDTNAPAYDPLDPRVYEMPAVWESGELPTYTNRMVIPAGATKVGHAYRVRVRMKDTTGRWSHWSEPVGFVVEEPTTSAALRQSLRVTEIMYQPPSGSDTEFVELCNISAETTLDLGGVAWTRGIDYTFPAGTSLPPGQYLVLTRASPVGEFADFRAAYDLGAEVTILGPYDGKLSNEGESLALKTAAAGKTIVDFTYGGGRGWPPAANGPGHSLVPLTLDHPADGGLDGSDHWRASTYIGGSPGGPDPAPVSSLVLNELLAHTDFSDPLYPGYDSNDRIEVVNLSAATLSLADWYLSDDPADLTRWPIPSSLVVGAGQWMAWDEVHGFHQPVTTGFGLNKAGETLLLSHLPGNGFNRVADAVDFGGQINGVSLGRYPDGTGPWYSLVPTLGQGNLPPASHVIISEIMYHPAPTAAHPADNTFDEYIEIHNPTRAAIPMWNPQGAWRISGAVNFVLPPAETLAAGGYALFVSFDPAVMPDQTAFLAAHGLSTGSVTLYGPWAGKLANSAERIALEWPQAPDRIGDSVSWVVVDEVAYGSRVGWPPEADGGGQALERRDDAPQTEGAGSWQAVNPSGTPGRGPDLDDDGDGLPDSWEWFTFGGTSAANGLWDEDFDADGRANGLEYVTGTPGNLQNTMPDLTLSKTGTGVVVHFDTRVANGSGYFGRTRFYDLESTVEVGNAWTQVPALVHRPGDGESVSHTNTSTAAEGAFRLRILLE